ncbi:mannosyltransferase family protein [Catenuloplanes sp. NPDC051500]|uniref:mannosyltransferase family protein n=1 Tax=Catenuloplanes sp. NPDC051500 TaxID=3363959 RepID=UPI00379BA061
MTQLATADLELPQERTGIRSPWRAAFIVAIAAWSAATAIRLAITALTPHGVMDWVQWDAVLYVRIAEAGYHVGGPSYPAFFPLYPLLIRLADPILPGGGIASALVIANLSAIGALALLHRLAEHETDPLTAQRAVWFLTASPMGFFLFVGYNESLFLMLSIGALYAARKGHWWVAGSLGALSSATRLFGVLLMLPLAIEYLRHAGWQPRRIRLDVLGIALVPMGVVAYSIYCWRELGSPMAFSAAQDQWSRQYTIPGGAWVISAGQSDGWLGPQTLGSIIDAGSMLVVVVLMILCVVGPYRFRLDQAYLVAYSAICVLLVLSTEVGGRALQSAPRYAMEAIAIFLVMGRIGARPTADRVMLTIGMALHAALLIIYMNGNFLVA